ncbi:magnesium chelatase subunit D [Mumia flava]|uniref:Mg-protoporphyrin IX chelatase n=1 Tax=Mumia flava TaxID=1348852 RepID=A0A0B2BUW6_9ACTN|nr:VWA domain-containing protein [Mumia flava]PJJ58024.1 magnesium chelatase subunit D [Mumia flava]
MPSAVTSTPHYPFSAVVGAEDMTLALVLAAIAPELGGVLVRGEKGTAKTTTVRALTALLPDVAVVDGCRFSCDPVSPDPGCPDGPHAPSAVRTDRPARLVELPVAASEDRVVGSLHLGRALADGVAEFEPGLLASAHRGVLYVDEANLLGDHLVDVLLDAAATGRTRVEREGVSVTHASRFVLVGTMNPEEGELRPQLLDRFGLSAEVAAPRDPRTRVEVVRRRLAYEADPAAFLADHGGAERELAARIADARARLGAVRLDDAMLLVVARVCAGFDVDGMRADLVTAQAARAHAAWRGGDTVAREDVRAAARLAIAHRIRRNPFDAPGIDEDLLDELLGDEQPPEPPPAPGPDDGDSDGDGDGDGPGGGGEPPQSSAGDSPADPPPTTGSSTDPPTSSVDPPTSSVEPPTASVEPPTSSVDPVETTPDPGPPAATPVAAGPAYRPRLFSLTGTGAGADGRRSRARTDRGRTVGSRRATPSESGPVHLLATLRAAAPHQQARGRSTGSAVRLRPSDLRFAVREGREGNLVLLCVDASGSMGARRRMEQVKTAVLSLLLDAYQRRDRVGLVTFRGPGAELVLPPTGSVDVAAARLDAVPTGGRTPLAEGLRESVAVIERASRRDPDRRPLLVVVTDGRATAGPDALGRASAAARDVAAAGIRTVVLDCESGALRLGLAADLATDLRADHVPIGEVAASTLTSTIRRVRAGSRRTDPAASRRIVDGTGRVA